MNIDLTQSELEHIDIIAAANVIYNRTRDLSIAVNTELMEPISAWIDDPDFMKKHKVMIDSKAPNWAEYKKNQRQWTEQQKQIAAERLRLYWQEIRRKRKMRKALHSLIPRAGPKTASTDIDLQGAATRALAEIVAPFSPPEQLRAKTRTEFREARHRPPSSILPWGTILNCTIRSYSTFESLPQYLPTEKADIVAKLQTLLQMESDNTLSLVQQEPFGEIEIEINQTNESNQLSTEGSIIIKDQEGNTCNLEWQDLSDAQRDKVIADLIENVIICVA